MLHGVIMAGGAGTRFWPASRKETPKQLLSLLGEQSMLQSTVQRLEGLIADDDVMIVTNKILVDPIAAQLPQLAKGSVIGEPAKRDTAPCVGLAAALVAAKDPDGIMLVMPADHVIQDKQSFANAINHAVTLIGNDEERIITFGIKPTYPAEVFGYIERAAAPIGGQFPTFCVERFREKPDGETAKQFMDAGTFYWNSGIFVWKAKTILAALKEFSPDIYTHIEKIGAAVGTDSFDETMEREFCAINGTSIDYAVMEKYSNVIVVEAPFDWDDLGNWTALPRLSGTDKNGNTIAAKHLGIQTKGTLVRADDDHLIVTLGLEDCVVVRTADATLIARKDLEAEVKTVVKKLEEKGWTKYL